MKPRLPELYSVWVEAKNTRVYGIDDDHEGSLWFTGSLNLLHRYWPANGDIETREIPEKHGGSQCLCAGDKVYVLPQTNEKITVCDVAEGRVYQVDKPFPEANRDPTNPRQSPSQQLHEPLQYFCQVIPIPMQTAEQLKRAHRELFVLQ